MADEELRRLERRAATTGDDADGAALAAARVRAGVELPGPRVVPRESRRATLLAADVPAVFLDVLAGRERPGDEEPFGIRDEADAYGYLEQLTPESTLAPEWSCLGGQDVTPVHTEGTGETFVLLLQSAGSRRFVSFGLEEGLLTDFGRNFQFALADLVIELYDRLMPESAPEVVVALAAELGFARPKELIDELQRSSRRTFESDEAWRAEVLPRLLA